MIDRLAADLHRAFIVQQAAAQIPRFHDRVILDKIKDPEERPWYARATKFDSEGGRTGPSHRGPIPAGGPSP